MMTGSSCRRGNRVNVQHLQSPAPALYARELSLFAAAASLHACHDRYHGRSGQLAREPRASHTSKRAQLIAKSAEKLLDE
jgi:hypothetical protein